MAYDDVLAERVRDLLASRSDVVEKRMFGGLCFMVSGHMCCGPHGTDLMVRVGKPAWEAALREPGAREMDFTGKSLKGMVWVSGEALEDDAALEAWVQRGLDFVETLPPK